MDNFLNDKENVHDSSIMRYVNCIVKYVDTMIGSSEQPTGLNRAILNSVGGNMEKFNVVISTLDYIRAGYKKEINAILTFALTQSDDLSAEIFKEIYALASSDSSSYIPKCPTGYLNNIVIIIPIYFPNTFNTTVVPIPVIMEEIDTVIDKAVDTNMPAEMFVEEMSFYIREYGFSAPVKKKCSSLINFYISEAKN